MPRKPKALRLGWVVVALQAVLAGVFGGVLFSFPNPCGVSARDECTKRNHPENQGGGPVMEGGGWESGRRAMIGRPPLQSISAVVLNAWGRMNLFP